MKRALMQIYAERSDGALAFYQEAFGAELLCCYPNEDGTLFHAELDLGGVILALAERRGAYAIEGEAVSGNTMQWGLEFGPEKEEQLRKAYEVLQRQAQILLPLGPCDYSLLMADLVDKYGARWCLFL